MKPNGVKQPGGNPIRGTSAELRSKAFSIPIHEGKRSTLRARDPSKRGLNRLTRAGGMC